MSIGLTSFYSLNRSEALKQDRLTIVTALRQARSLTLAAKDDSQHGIHFDTSRLVLFKGTLYSDSDPSNVPYVLNSLVTISNVSLTGGGNDVLFQKLSGATAQPGTITLSLKDGSKSSIVSVFSTGIIEGE